MVILIFKDTARIYIQNNSTAKINKWKIKSSAQQDIFEIKKNSFNEILILKKNSFIKIIYYHK